MMLWASRSYVTSVTRDLKFPQLGPDSCEEGSSNKAKCARRARCHHCQLQVSSQMSTSTNGQQCLCPISAIRASMGLYPQLEALEAEVPPVKQPPGSSEREERICVFKSIIPLQKHITRVEILCVFIVLSISGKFTCISSSLAQYGHSVDYIILWSSSKLAVTWYKQETEEKLSSVMPRHHVG